MARTPRTLIVRFCDREMRFVPGILRPQKGVRRILHGLRGFVNGPFMMGESA